MNLVTPCVHRTEPTLRSVFRVGIASAVVGSLDFAASGCHARDLRPAVHSAAEAPPNLNAEEETPEQDTAISFEIATTALPRKDPFGWPCRAHEVGVHQAGTLEFVFGDLRDVSALDCREYGRARFALASPFAGREHLEPGDLFLLFSVSPDWTRIRLTTLRGERVEAAFEARLAARSVPSRSALEQPLGPLDHGRSMRAKSRMPTNAWIDVVTGSWNGAGTDTRARIRLQLIEGNYSISEATDEALIRNKSIPEWPEPVWWLSIRFTPDP